MGKVVLFFQILLDLLHDPCGGKLILFRKEALNIPVKMLANRILQGESAQKNIVQQFFSEVDKLRVAPIQPGQGVVEELRSVFF